MGGRAQADWQHSVPYLGNRPVGERISLQWRFANKVGKPYIGASYRAPLHYSQRPLTSQRAAALQFRDRRGDAGDRAECSPGSPG